MPFESKKQMLWMKINQPEIYKKWIKKYGPYKSKKQKKR